MLVARRDDNGPALVETGADSGTGTGSLSTNSKSKAAARRAFHRKVKTGCLTCKIRRVKCDEQRPACRKCTSTGRTCDGYEPAVVVTPGGGGQSEFPRPPCSSGTGNLHLAYKLSLPRSNHDEIRSYRYFVDVTAPAVAGVFDFEFWQHEIPRVCHGDSAIWHAVVSLGAAYELSRGCRFNMHNSKLRTLSLQQYSKSVKSLLHAPHTKQDLWRGLCISVIFTLFCNIHGLHSEAEVHMRSGRSILEELKRGLPRPKRASPSTTPSGGTFNSSNSPDLPVSIEQISTMMSNLEIQTSANEFGGLLRAQHLLAESDSFNIWRYYQWTGIKPPLYQLSPSEARVRFAKELLRANQAADSLKNGLIYYRQESFTFTERIIKERSLHYIDTCEAISELEKPYVRCYFELVRARADLDKMRREEIKPIPWKGLDTLSLLLTTTRLIFLRDPEIPDSAARKAALSGFHTSMCDLAEKILRSEPATEEDRNPDSVILGPLSLVAHGAPPQSLRRRAIAIMGKFHLRDGLVESWMQSRIYHNMLEREQWLLQHNGDDEGPRSECAGPPQGWNTPKTSEREVPASGRMFSMSFSFEGERSARVAWRTWGEQFGGLQGESRLVTW